MSPVIEIDSRSGFCYGVIRAIALSEQALEQGRPLYCLGQIVHNNKEMERLQAKGLQVITKDSLPVAQNSRMVIRAHGEPPEIYKKAGKLNITLIEATCPVVLRLQQNIKKEYASIRARNGLILIYGRKGHAEVNGLMGQIDDPRDSCVLESLDDLYKIDYSRPLRLFSQTTQDTEAYRSMIQAIGQHTPRPKDFKAFHTICKQVSDRRNFIADFARRHDRILFICGKQSSNGRILYNLCKQTNPNTFVIESKEDVSLSMLSPAQSIGICGATSTPKWLMEEIAIQCQKLLE